MQATRLTAPPSPGQGAGDDVQARVPGVRVALSRVGVTGVEKVVRIREELYFARLDSDGRKDMRRIVLVR